MIDKNSRTKVLNSYSYRAPLFNKKGQATIFILVGIAIIALLAVLLFLRYGPDREGSGAKEEIEVKNYIEKCATENAVNIADEMILHGGFINSTNVKLFNNISVEYLCRNNGYFKPCVNQHAALISEMEEELVQHISPKLSKCFEDIDKQLKKKGANVKAEAPQIRALFVYDKIILKIKRNMSLEYHDQKFQFSDFDSEVSHPIYNFGVVARDIVNNEASYCYFENVGYVTLHTEFRIRRVALSDETKIYQISHIPTGKDLTFAVRGCAVRAGL